MLVDRPNAYNHFTNNCLFDPLFANKKWTQDRQPNPRDCMLGKIELALRKNPKEKP